MLKDQILYLLDANAIRMLSYDTMQKLAKKGIKFFTIEDVLFEVQSLKKIDGLEVNQLDARSYSLMREIINKHESTRRIIDYINNKGAADIALLAYSLSKDDGRLISDEYVIVSNDNGLQNACQDLNLPWLSVEDFKLL